MISVYRVYRALKDLANKEQRGFVTPVAFNSFAGMAQMNVYNEMFDELSNERRARNRTEGRGRSLEGRALKMQDLSMYVKVDTVSQSSSLFDKPDDLSRIISIEAGTSAGNSAGVGHAASGSTLTKCELVYDMEKANLLLNSNLSTPTQDFPIALVHDSIELFPTDLTNIKVVYYRVPGSYNNRGEDSMLSPSYAYTVNPNNPSQHIFDAKNSMDFMLPEHLFPEIVYEMSKLIGVRLRDRDLLSYGKEEETAN